MCLGSAHKRPIARERLSVPLTHTVRSLSFLLFSISFRSYFSNLKPRDLVIVSAYLLSSPLIEDEEEDDEEDDE